MDKLEKKLIAVLVAWLASEDRTWKSLLQAAVNAVGIPTIVAAQMPAVEEMLAAECANVKPNVRTKVAKVALTRALQHIV